MKAMMISLMLFVFIGIAGASESIYFITNSCGPTYGVNLPAGYWKLNSGSIDRLEEVKGEIPRIIPNLVVGKYLIVGDLNYCLIDQRTPEQTSKSKFTDYVYISNMFWADMGKFTRFYILKWDDPAQRIHPTLIDFAEKTEAPNYDVDPNSFYYQGASRFLFNRTTFFDFSIKGDIAKIWITGKERTIDCLIPQGLSGPQRIFVSTPELFVYGDMKSYETDYTTYRIQIREKNQLDSLRVRGGYSWPQAFGYWLCATVYENTERKKGISPGRERRKAYFKEHQITPEQEKQILGDYYNLEGTETGLSFDSQASGIAYAPGIVIAYNVDTKQYIEMNTGEGDSEILLIEGNVMYWREFDEIYRAPITPTGIGEKTLVVKGPPVPDIHWMFLTKEGEE